MFNNIDSFIEANAVGQITNVLKLCNKGSIQNSDCGYCEASYKDRNSLPDLICPISPLDYAREIMKINNNPQIPKILLAYGSGTGTLGSDDQEGDGIVPFSNADILRNKLANFCTLHELVNVKHDDFVLHQNENGDDIYPLICRDNNYKKTISDFIEDYL